MLWCKNRHTLCSAIDTRPKFVVGPTPPPIPEISIIYAKIREKHRKWAIRAGPPTLWKTHEQIRRAVTKEGDELEWRRFLVQVHADVRSPGGSGEEDSDDDRDYSYQEDPTSRRQPEEEWESGRHFTIPLDEVKDLVTESTKYRTI